MNKHTFADFESQPYFKPDISTSLIEWYAKIRDIDFGLLEAADIARAICQKMMVKELVIPAIDRISDDPYCGFNWNGQLLEQLADISVEYWKDKPSEVNYIVLKLPLIKKQLFSEINEESELTRDILDTLLRLESNINNEATNAGQMPTQ